MQVQCCDFSPPANRTAKALVAILEGVPAGLTLDFDGITAELRRRQTGYGRGRRMAIESDRAEALERRPPRASTGAPDRAAHSEQGLGELAAHDARRGGDAESARPASIARR